MTFTGSIDEHGKLSLDQTPAFIRGTLVRKKLAGREVEVTIDRKRRKQKHNRYYFAALVSPIADGLADYQGEPVTVDQAHELLKSKWGKDKIIVDPTTGEELTNGKTTRTMNAQEFETYCLKVERWGSEFLGIDWAGLDRKKLLDDLVFELKD